MGICFTGRRLGASFLATVLALPSGGQTSRPHPPETKNYTEPGHTYWHDDDKNIILDLGPCGSSLCAKFHAIDARDARVKNMVAFMVQKDGWYHSHKYGKEINDDDVVKVCQDYRQIFRDLQEKKTGIWVGHYEYHTVAPHDPKEGGTTGRAKIVQTDKDLTIYASIGIWPRSDHYYRIENPGPACPRPSDVPFPK